MCLAPARRITRRSQTRSAAADFGNRSKTSCIHPTNCEHLFPYAVRGRHLTQRTAHSACSGSRTVNFGVFQGRKQFSLTKRELLFAPRELYLSGRDSSREKREPSPALRERYLGPRGASLATREFYLGLRDSSLAPAQRSLGIREAYLGFRDSSLSAENASLLPVPPSPSLQSPPLPVASSPRLAAFTLHRPLTCPGTKEAGTARPGTLKTSHQPQPPRKSI
jgi:hypothetical protein